MRDQELSDRAGITRQQVAVRPSSHAMMGNLNHLFGRDVLLLRRRRPADAENSGNLRDLQPRFAVQKKMAQHSPGVVIPAAVLNEEKTGFQHGDPIGRELLSVDLRLAKPLIERRTTRSHGIPSFLLDAWSRQYTSVGLSG